MSLEHTVITRFLRNEGGLRKFIFTSYHFYFDNADNAVLENESLLRHKVSAGTAARSELVFENRIAVCVVIAVIILSVIRFEFV